MHGAWLIPPSLSELKGKEYLGPKDPQLTQDYREVQKDETNVLAIILQWCTIWGRAPPNTICRAVQELHMHMALVVEDGDWSNMEKEIWEGVMKAPWLLLHQELPCQIEYHCRHLK